MNDNCSGSCTHHAQTDKKLSTLPAIEPSSGFVSLFSIPKMDCPSEERMIRMALDDLRPEIALEFDTPQRKLKVFYINHLEAIQSRLESLDLGTTLDSTQPVGGSELSQAVSSAEAVNQNEAGVLKWLLAINGLMFGIEMVAGWYAQSTGLLADSLDMFADTAVYGLALYVVGRGTRMKLHAAHFSGWLQIILALGALSEVVRRFIFGSEPMSELMMGFGFFALIANSLCLILINKQRGSGAHMKASWIFSANDVIANAGVIVAGLLVAVTSSRYPDLVIGFIIALVVLNGARRILQLKS